MHDRSMLLELFLEVKEAIRRIERRFSGIGSSHDFLRNDEGLDRLDAIAMMLVAIGENLQRISDRVDQSMFDRYPNVNWKGAKGIRNLLAHNYFNIDAEEVFKVCSQDIEPLKQAIQNIRNDIF
ncbi:MAG: DUF86 domain-containing protein [Leptolyngbyaceae cyanobacterium SM2_5_2]|nr:DUF86 domain-containing protein [Leptolyngbyaceae cyanobacterium SM2_5_2]